jgi:ATP-dependent Clp protease adaptor protein ClpS
MPPAVIDPRFGAGTAPAFGSMEIRGAAGRRDADPEREEGLAIRERPKTRRPPMYRVLLHNDDYTAMEFVIEILMTHFEKTVTEATRIALQVHHAGIGIAGVYTRDEAETRMTVVIDAARAQGYPLQMSMEPDE